MKQTLLAVLLFLAVAHGQQKLSGEGVITSMHDRYAGKWYSTLTFVQTTTRFLADSTRSTATWYEASSFPGTLRIDIGTPGTNGMIFKGDSAYTFRDGQLVTTRFLVHPLLLLGFDIYFLDPSVTAEKLKGLHFDLSLVHEAVWEGRPVYVVGAKEGDLHSRQFWIDCERLVFVRMLEPGGRDSSQTRETLFNKYQKLGDGWISAEVVFKTDGKIQMTEEYSDIHADGQLDAHLFDPGQWRTARWKR